METPDGQKNIHRRTKGRSKETKDFAHISNIKDKNRNILYDDETVRNRWKEYLDDLLNVENSRISEGVANERK